MLQPLQVQLCANEGRSFTVLPLLSENRCFKGNSRKHGSRCTLIQLTGDELDRGISLTSNFKAYKTTGCDLGCKGNKQRLQSQGKRVFLKAERASSSGREGTRLESGLLSWIASSVSWEMCALDKSLNRPELQFLFQNGEVELNP